MTVDTLQSVSNSGASPPQGQHAPVQAYARHAHHRVHGVRVATGAPPPAEAAPPVAKQGDSVELHPPRTAADAVESTKPSADAPATTSPAEAEAGPTRAEVESAAAEVNRMMAAAGQDRRFAVHEETGRFYVEVVDAESKEVLKVLPSQEMLDLSARIREAVGMILDVQG